MTIASRMKKLALCASAGLLFVASASFAAQYTYVPTSLKVKFTNRARQTDTLQFQQGGKLEVSGSNSNTFQNNLATTDAFGLSFAALADTSSSTVTGASTGITPLQVNSSANQYFLFSGAISLNNLSEAQTLRSGAGGVPPYTLTDSITVSITGATIPSGTYKAGTKFAVSVPVTVTTAAGVTETDTFTGKLVLGELRGLTSDRGNLTGTRLIPIHITGSLTDSAGETYDINQVFGQNDLDGITPDQIMLNYTLTQQ